MSRLSVWWHDFVNDERDVFGRPIDLAPTDPIELGARAKALLDDPLLKLALDKIEEKLNATWRHSKVGDTEAREAAYRLYWAIEQLRSELRAMRDNAKVLEAEPHS